MTRKELKEIIARVIVRLEKEAPKPACVFGDCDCDDKCDVTTYYAVGEEG